MRWGFSLFLFLMASNLQAQINWWHDTDAAPVKNMGFYDCFLDVSDSSIYFRMENDTLSFYELIIENYITDSVLLKTDGFDISQVYFPIKSQKIDSFPDNLLEKLVIIQKADISPDIKIKKSKKVKSKCPKKSNDCFSRSYYSYTLEINMKQSYYICFISDLNPKEIGNDLIKMTYFMKGKNYSILITFLPGYIPRAMMDYRNELFFIERY
ncbi:MAG: hypothetical protein ACOZCO_10455 [Bacteroidota bacterium]